MNVIELENYIKKCIKAYYSGNPIVSDSEYDSLIEELQITNPNSLLLNVMELNGSDWNFPKEELPYKLYSIKKIKEIKEIKNWIKFISKKITGLDSGLSDFKVCITGKYDGQKILGYKGNYYTRGEDGIEAFNVSSRIRKCKLQKIYHDQEGELICSRQNFEKYFKNLYTSPRNLVPSVFSNETPIDNLDKFDWICYSLYNSYLDKSHQIEICNETNTYKVPYVIKNVSELTEEMLFDLFQEFSKDYILDGLVIDVEEYRYRNLLGFTTKYLDCCRAYKADNLNQDIKQSKIIDITYQLSRYGKIAPVANIEPVSIHNGEVTNVSLYNIKYIKDNNIYIGQEILVERRGAINPKIYDFLTKDKLADIPECCPYCGTPLVWNETNVDLFCPNKECKEKISQQIYFFFKTLGVKDFGLKSIRNLILNGNFSSLKDFFDREKLYSTNIEGIGTKTIDIFCKELDKLKNEGVKLEVLQEASGCFEGIAKSTFKILNTSKVDMQYYYIDSYYNEKIKEINSLEGIGEITTREYLAGLPNFYEFISEFKDKILIIEENKKEQILNLENYKVVFTGFRDNSLKEFIENNGGKVLSSISSNCTHLIQKNKDSNTSKTQEAKKLGIIILGLEEFKKLLNYK